MMSRRRYGVPAFLYFTAALIFAAAFIGIMLVINNLGMPVDRQATSTQVFEIKKGESVSSVSDRLAEARLIRSALGFKVFVKKDSLDNKIQAGVYKLSPSMSASEIAKALTKGVNDVKVTIPEGFRQEQIGETVENALGVKRADFLAAAEGKEGMLFPDTYFFAAGTGADKIVDTMTQTFSTKTASLAVTPQDVILASLVERETKGDAEKPVVAGILLKRLDAGWPLQLDATIQYLAGKSGDWWPKTTLLDRARPSLYNTYLNPGLPPGPIANPGLKSITAVKNPQDSEYWYYLHAPDGTIHYAETSAEHESNIDKYLR